MTMPAIADVNVGDDITDTLWNNTKNTIRNHYQSYAVENVGAQTIAGVKTFSAIPVFSLGITVAAGGVTITGNSTITGTLTALTGITSSGTASFATLNASGATTIAALACTTINASGAITGTLGTAAQTNITSLGTLTALTISGTLTLSNASPIALAATSKFVVGATSFSIKDSGDGVTAFGITGTGAATTIGIACGSSGAITLTGLSSATAVLTANVALSAPSGKILFSTNGTDPIATDSTTRFPHMPYTADTPTGILGSGNIGAFCFEASGNHVCVWSSGGWRFIDTSATP